MSEFDKLKDEGEDYARQHPQQVKEGEDAVEKKLGIGQDDGQQNDGQQSDGQQDGGQDGAARPGPDTAGQAHDQG